jgi:uncharacterized sporulation protein YeaH/YhbH (DUF444 family)
MYIIDRRLNPGGKSLVNRQRFLRRAKGMVQRAVRDSLGDRSIKELDQESEVTIVRDGIAEPSLRRAPTGGNRDHILPGNEEYLEGDKIQRPSGQGGGGTEAGTGEGEDDFRFVLTREEFLDLFLDDLELPDLAKRRLIAGEAEGVRRAGYTISGSPSRLSVTRTMRNSLSRRIALGRPGTEEMRRLDEEIEGLEGSGEDPDRLEHLRAERAALERRRRIISYIDPIDLRYRRYEPTPKPVAQAVMFCLMDVSGSMGEREKDLAKRFYMLLHLFLKRRYKRVDIVFIRHTHDAQEVDEQEFFYSRQSGGTIVSTALDKMLEIQKERYATADWNIYAAQASDGYTQSGDARRCVEMLNNDIMPLCQYYAYIEILDEREMEVFASEESGAELWRAYRTVADEWSNFATKRISKPADIFPVFRELFKKTEAA